MGTLREFAKSALPPRYAIRIRALNHWRLFPEVQALKLLTHPLKDSIDVGGFIGVHTYFISRHSRRVFTYEPNPERARFLQRAFRSPKVTVHQAAVSDRVGTSKLFAPEDYFHAPEASLRSVVSQRYACTAIDVRTTTLDAAGHRDIGFIKIDVEGHEEAVIDGSAKLLEREHPTLLIELERRHLDKAPQEVFRKLTAFGYRGWFIQSDGIVSIDRFSEDRHQRLSDIGTARYCNNFIFALEDRFKP